MQSHVKTKHTRHLIANPATLPLGKKGMQVHVVMQSGMTHSPTEKTDDPVWHMVGAHVGITTVCLVYTPLHTYLQYIVHT